MNFMELDIERSRCTRKWSVHTSQHWDGGPAAHTYKPANTLAYAIYREAVWAANNDTKIVSIDVKGQLYPREKVLAAIRKFADGVPEYGHLVAVFTHLHLPLSVVLT